MRKDKKDPIDVNPIMANLSLTKFKEFHKKWVKNDTLTAEQRYKKIGGKA